VSYYFLEVNFWIQVEHPITEEVTGVDIVALQLSVAAGENLSRLPLGEMGQTGHAIECQLCAEDPQRDFLPELGTIHLWRPAGGDNGGDRHIRFETVVSSGT
jgi:acetyl/propionyl-CoA carboxylase alpha subunit